MQCGRGGEAGSNGAPAGSEPERSGGWRVTAQRRQGLRRRCPVGELPIDQGAGCAAAGRRVRGERKSAAAARTGRRSARLQTACHCPLRRHT